MINMLVAADDIGRRNTVGRDANAALVAGEEVVVTGLVQRRFFRSGGVTQTRTELVAERCLRARRTKSVRSLLAAAAANLTP